MKQKNKVTKFVVFAVIFAVIAAAGVVLWNTIFSDKSPSSSPTKLQGSGFVALSDFSSDYKVVDLTSALSAVEVFSEDMGISNVKEEVSEGTESSVYDYKIYKFNQSYKGIPVYGHSISLMSDNNGNLLSISGNYNDIDNISTEYKVSQSDAEKIVKENYGNIVSLLREGLSIYVKDNEAKLAWTFYVKTDRTSEYCFISADDTSIVANLTQTYVDNERVGYGKDIDDVDKIFNVSYEDNTFYLKDNERNIQIYDANNGTLVCDKVLCDENSNIYIWDTDKQKFLDEKNREVKVETGNNPYGNFSVYDMEGNLISSKVCYAFKLHTKNIFTDVYPVSSKNNVWDNKKAVTLISRVADVFDFYNTFFQRKGFNDMYGEVLVVFNDFKGFDVENAYSTTVGGAATLLGFGTDNTLSADIVGHEYTHSVEATISGMIYSGESGALMEAYSDIFGELFEDWQDDRILNNSCDWIHNGSRNFRNPTDCKLPERYEGEFWHSTVDKGDENDHGGVHTNNTVISRAACLMLNGIDGHSPAFQPLGEEELAKLFYSTLYLLPPNCSFSEFRTLTQNMASIMVKRGELTQNQYRCVSNAFFQVGIMPATLPVSSKSSIEVYGYNGEKYHNYTLYIKHNGIQESYSSDKVEKGLSFDDLGEYELLVVDNSNSDGRVTIKVDVVEKGGATIIPIETSYGLSSSNDTSSSSSSTSSSSDGNTSSTENSDIDEPQSKLKQFLVSNIFSCGAHMPEACEFLENGVVRRYTAGVNADYGDYIISFENEGRYTISGNTLTIEMPNYSYNLELVRKSDNYDWDLGKYHLFPDDEPFFYETSFVPDDRPINAEYLVRLCENKFPEISSFNKTQLHGVVNTLEYWDGTSYDVHTCLQGIKPVVVRMPSNNGEIGYLCGSDRLNLDTDNVNLKNYQFYTIYGNLKSNNKTLTLTDITVVDEGELPSSTFSVNNYNDNSILGKWTSANGEDYIWFSSCSFTPIPDGLITRFSGDLKFNLYGVSGDSSYSMYAIRRAGYDYTLEYYDRGMKQELSVVFYKNCLMVGDRIFYKS